MAAMENPSLATVEFVRDSLPRRMRAVPIRNEERQSRVGTAIDTHGRGEPPEKMIDQRIGDEEGVTA